MLAKSTAPNHGAGRDDGWQNLRLKIKMSGGRANGGGEDEQRADGGRTGGQTKCLIGAMSSATSFLNAISLV
jgi:hypothetical protein